MATELTTQNPENQPPVVSKDELALGMILDDGNAFVTKRAATARLKELAIGESWEVAEYGIGFAIMRKLKAQEPEESPEPPKAEAPAVPPPEQFKWVKFHSKSNPMDPDEVVLACNGEVLQIRRNERIPLPQRFLEVAEHARYRHFTQEPGRDRKVDREIHKYPFDVQGDCTLADFVRWKKAGTKATREHAERIGIALEA